VLKAHHSEEVSMLANVDRARRILRDEGIDGVISSTLENNFYLTGVWNVIYEHFQYDTQSYVVASSDNVAGGIMVTSVGEADLALAAYSSIADNITFGKFFREVRPEAQLSQDELRIKARTIDRAQEPSAIDALVAGIAAAGLDRSVIAVDERGANRALIEELTSRVPQAKLVPGAQLFRRIRMVKTKDELERLVRALRITENAIRAAVAAASPGVTEAELHGVFERAIVDGGARPAFTHLRFGRNMALGQLPSGDTRLDKNDYIWFDVGCTYEGYRSDIGRIVVIGDADPHLLELGAASLAGQSCAIAMMKPGVLPNDIFEAVVDVVRHSGIPHYRRHHVGHGIGVEFYDQPTISPGSTTPLESNMIFEVETPYYELGFGGAFNEDTVLITESGSQILTELDRGILRAPSARAIN
jgi:Xaa-Pro aminopeptidase